MSQEDCQFSYNMKYINKNSLVARGTNLQMSITEMENKDNIHH